MLAAQPSPRRIWGTRPSKSQWRRAFPRHPSAFQIRPRSQLPPAPRTPSINKLSPSTPADPRCFPLAFDRRLQIPCRSACAGHLHIAWAHRPRRTAPPRRCYDCEGQPQVEGYVSTRRIVMASQLSACSTQRGPQLAPQVPTPCRLALSLCPPEIRKSAPAPAPAPAERDLTIALQTPPHVAHAIRPLGR